LITAVVTDLTRMTGNNVCIAALNLDTGQQIRLDFPQPIESDCSNLDIGAVINVEWTPGKDNKSPHIEDGPWDEKNLKIIKALNLGELRDLLVPLAKGRVEDIFGAPSRKAANGNIGYEPGVGHRSLGSLLVDKVNIKGEGNGLRVIFKDRDDQYVVPFQDLYMRLHQTTCAECNLRWIEQAAQSYAESPALVRLGLTRPYEVPGYHPLTCWLQVNHIILLDPAHPDHFRL